MACRFPHPYGRERENNQPRSPDSLMKLALKAVPNPAETARALLPPWHTVRIVLEKREFEEKREKDRQEHAKKFRYVMNELKYVDDLNWTWRLFPSHVLLLLQLTGFLLDPGRRDLYSAISILVPAILSGGAYRYL